MNYLILILILFLSSSSSYLYSIILYEKEAFQFDLKNELKWNNLFHINQDIDSNKDKYDFATLLEYSGLPTFKIKDNFFTFFGIKSLFILSVEDKSFAKNGLSPEMGIVLELDSIGIRYNYKTITEEEDKETRSELFFGYIGNNLMDYYDYHSYLKGEIDDRYVGITLKNDFLFLETNFWLQIHFTFGSNKLSSFSESGSIYISLFTIKKNKLSVLLSKEEQEKEKAFQKDLLQNFESQSFQENIFFSEKSRFSLIKGSLLFQFEKKIEHDPSDRPRGILYNRHLKDIYYRNLLKKIEKDQEHNFSKHVGSLLFQLEYFKFQKIYFVPYISYSFFFDNDSTTGPTKNLLGGAFLKYSIIPKYVMLGNNFFIHTNKFRKYKLNNDNKFIKLNNELIVYIYPLGLIAFEMMLSGNFIINLTKKKDIDYIVNIAFSYKV